MAERELAAMELMVPLLIGPHRSCRERGAISVDLSPHSARHDRIFGQVSLLWARTPKKEVPVTDYIVTSALVAAAAFGLAKWAPRPTRVPQFRK
jgi:hypothetical protein